MTGSLKKKKLLCGKTLLQTIRGMYGKTSPRVILDFYVTLLSRLLICRQMIDVRCLVLEYADFPRYSNLVLLDFCSSEFFTYLSIYGH